MALVKRLNLSGFKNILKSEGIESMLIDSRMSSFRRQKYYHNGEKVHPLLSVHTLEIGYDVPEVGIEDNSGNNF